LPEGTPIYTEMTTRAYLAFSARLRGLVPRSARRRVDEVADRCAVREYLDVLTGNLSRGYRQRVGLAQAIIHDPPVLVLDEPTAGIDPIQVAQTRVLIREMAKDRTILLSTHILPEASAICDRVVIIHEGRIRAQDRIQNLAAVLRGGRRIRVRVRGPADQVSQQLRRIDGVTDVRFEDPWHVLTHSADREPQAAVTGCLVQAGWTLLGMESEDMSLEDIFLRLTTEEAASGAGPTDPPSGREASP